MKKHVNTFLSVIWIFSFTMLPKKSHSNDLNQSLLLSTSNDSTRIKRYLKIAKLQQTNSIADSNEYSQKAVRLAKFIGHKELLAKSKLSVGIDFIQKDEYHKSIEFLNAAEAYFHTNKDTTNRISSLTHLGSCYYYLRDYSKARDYWSTGQQLAFTIGDMKEQSNFYFNLGLIHQDKFEYSKAIESFLYALNDNEPSVDKRASLLFKIAVCFQNLKEYNKAVTNYKEALALSKKSNDNFISKEIYKNLSECYSALGDIDLAKKQIDLMNTNTENNKQLKDSLAPSVLITGSNLTNSISLFNPKTKIENEKKNLIFFSSQTTVFIILSIFITWSSMAALLIKKLYTRKKINRLLNSKIKEEEKKQRLLQEVRDRKDKLFMITAHDVKAPLISLSEILKLFEKEEIETELIQDSFVKVNGRVKESLDTLENYLFWIKNQHHEIDPKPIKISVYTIFQDVIEKLEYYANEKRITILNKLDTDIYTFTDSLMLKIVFRNILSNAIKYSFDRNNITINSKKTDSMLEISVLDKGIGMTSSQLHELFSMNGNSKMGTNGEKGLGLGLVLSIDLLESNSGQLKVTSSEENGSTFTMILPKA